MLRYKLRTLLLIGALSPIVIAGLVWVLTPADPNVPPNPASQKATAEIRQMLLSATSLEIIEAGNAIRLGAESFDGESLKRLAQNATIVDVKLRNRAAATTYVENLFVHF